MIASAQQAAAPQKVIDKTPRIVIVGAGFGGLAAAKSLKDTRAHITVIDRANHHVFQPLLYQVATAVLAPGQIAAPIRAVLSKHENTTVIEATVTGVDIARGGEGCVIATNADRENVRIAYDYLILATGARHSYFAHPEFEQFAPGLKSLADAEAMRNKILQAFEQAEAEEDPNKHRELLTFVLVGAGPTGVEMAAALAVLVRTTLRSQYRRIDPTSARIVLADMGPRVLGTFAESLSAAAKRRLEKLGVEVQLGKGVDAIDQFGVTVAGQRINAATVIWTAGVAPSPAGKWLGSGTPMDKAGRVRVQPDCSVPGHANIFVVGDTASLDRKGKPLPGVAQVAMQQGRYVGKLLCARLRGRPDPKPFSYFDKGNMAVVGKGFAVLESHQIRMSGFLAWLAWMFIHVQFLAQPAMRIGVFLVWVWTFLTGRRGDRLIITPTSPQAPAFTPSPPAAPPRPPAGTPAATPAPAVAPTPVRA